MDRDALAPAARLDAWALSDARLELIEAGHINPTWRVDHARGRYVLQRLNPIFSPQLHHDIEAITARLVEAGLTTPRLVPTTTQALWHTDAGGGVWRVLTFIEGETLLAADSPERCRAAGSLLGTFHRALWDHAHEFHFSRLGVHDTPAHIAKLERALDEHRAHPRYAAVSPLCREVLEAAGALDLSRALPVRLVHGDPKISNFIFAPDGSARCLIDLDTLGRMPIAVELGDAFRSWGNPSGEEAEAAFEERFFEAGLSGYAAAIGGLPAPEERAAIPAYIEIISVELAARFAADALNERYFGWDRARFTSASEHNQARARSQLALARSVRAQLARLEELTVQAWAREAAD
jgi:Ser/Thr protein kinase RdoA (MazF antagonist)